MTMDNSLWAYFAHAGVMVKFVLLLLFAASVLSWALIIQRGLLLKKSRANFKKFEEQFWSGIEFNKLYSKMPETIDPIYGLQNIFRSGLREFNKTSTRIGCSGDAALQGAKRAMKVAKTRGVEALEKNLAILATIGSTSPYVGLFGTVWGIMTVFHSLGSVQQATISMVAPGISEALIATAMGLFAAIPAVVAYNRYADEIERLESNYDTFQEEFTALLYRQCELPQSPVKGNAS